MIILVDMDGVVADFEAGHRIYCNRKELPPEALGVNRTCWDILEAIREDPDLCEVVMQGWHEPGFFANLPPIAGSINAVHLLARRHQVYFCTAPLKNHATCASEKIDWVRRHLPGFESRVIISGDKTLVHGDILIDDKPDIHGVKTPTWEHYLFAQPYNQLSVRTRWTWAALINTLVNQR